MDLPQADRRCTGASVAVRHDLRRRARSCHRARWRARIYFTVRERYVGARPCIRRGRATVRGSVSRSPVTPPPRADIHSLRCGGATRDFRRRPRLHQRVHTRYVGAVVRRLDVELRAAGRSSAPRQTGIPPNRASYSAAYDAVANRLFVFGGNAAGRISSEFWVLEHANGLGGQPAWNPYHGGGTAPTLTNAAAVRFNDAHVGPVRRKRFDTYNRREVWRVTNLD